MTHADLLMRAIFAALDSPAKTDVEREAEAMIRHHAWEGDDGRYAAEMRARAHVGLWQQALPYDRAGVAQSRIDYWRAVLRHIRGETQ